MVNDHAGSGVGGVGGGGNDDEDDDGDSCRNVLDGEVDDPILVMPVTEEEEARWREELDRIRDETTRLRLLVKDLGPDEVAYYDPAHIGIVDDGDDIDDGHHRTTTAALPNVL